MNFRWVAQGQHVIPFVDPWEKKFIANYWSLGAFKEAVENGSISFFQYPEDVERD